MIWPDLKYVLNRGFDKGLKIRIGNGRLARITEDIWAGDQKLQLRHSLQGGPPAESKVAELISENRTWRSSLIWRWFKKEDAHNILAIPLQRQDHHDEIIWGRTKHGNYTVKSGYWFLMGRQGTQQTPPGFWKGLWKRKIPPKWKFFIWRIIQGALPTTNNMRKRGMTVNPWCVLCREEQETEEHLLRDCKLSKRIWAAGSLGLRTDSNQLIPIKDWIQNTIQLFIKEDGTSEDRIINFVSTLWAIWLHRNEIIFKQSQLNPCYIMSRQKDLQLGWLKTLQLPELAHKNQTIDHEKGTNLRWAVGSRIGQHILHLVVDGAWKELGNGNKKRHIAAVGWFINFQGNVTKGGKRVKANSALQAEAHAVWEGLQQAISLSHNIIIYTDCKGVIYGLQKPHQVDSSVVPIIRDIINLTSSMQFLESLVESLVTKVKAWEVEKGMTFLYDKEPLLKQLEEYTSQRQQREEDKRKTREQKKLQEQLATEKEALYGSRPKKPLGQSISNNTMVGTPTARRIGTPSGRGVSGSKDRRESTRVIPVNFVALAKDDPVSRGS